MSVSRKKQDISDSFSEIVSYSEDEFSTVSLSSSQDSLRSSSPVFVQYDEDIADLKIENEQLKQKIKALEVRLTSQSSSQLIFAKLQAESDKEIHDVQFHMDDDEVLFHLEDMLDDEEPVISHTIDETPVVVFHYIANKVNFHLENDEIIDAAEYENRLRM